MALKLVIIGGGSSYTPEIMEGILKRHESFPVSEIVLVDIEEGIEKVTIICALSIRMAKAAGKSIKISWTLDRKSALVDADFVTTQIRVGGLEAREKDERIPLSYGLIGQETNGAGGMSKALRTIPVLMELARDVHNICPNAWIINFTNPAGIVTEALLKYSPHKKVIGVCNIPHNMRHSTAEILQVHPDDVSIEFIGINHFIFGKKILVKNIDRTKEVLNKLLNHDLNYSPSNIVSLGWSDIFINALKLLPNPYHQYYFQTKEVLKKDIQSYKENGTRAEVVRKLEKSLFTIYQNTSLQEKPKELEERGGAYYSDVACSLMDSIYNNKKDIQTVNTLNNGAISDLPDDVVIETNCVITNNGPQTISVGPLPDMIKSSILQMKTFENLVIRASLTGNYYEAYKALVINPLVADERLSKLVLDELLKVHQAYLPQFTTTSKNIIGDKH